MAKKKKAKQTAKTKPDIPLEALALPAEGRFLGVIVVEMDRPSVAACATF